jgi:hypothetical protein
VLGLALAGDGEAQEALGLERADRVVSVGAAGLFVDKDQFVREVVGAGVVEGGRGGASPESWRSNAGERDLSPVAL